MRSMDCQRCGVSLNLIGLDQDRNMLVDQYQFRRRYERCRGCGQDEAWNENIVDEGNRPALLEFDELRQWLNRQSWVEGLNQRRSRHPDRLRRQEFEERVLGRFPIDSERTEFGEWLRYQTMNEMIRMRGSEMDLNFWLRVIPDQYRSIALPIAREISHRYINAVARDRIKSQLIRELITEITDAINHRARTEIRNRRPMGRSRRDEPSEVLGVPYGGPRVEMGGHRREPPETSPLVPTPWFDIETAGGIVYGENGQSMRESNIVFDSESGFRERFDDGIGYKPKAEPKVEIVGVTTKKRRIITDEE